MHSDKYNSVMAIARGLISSLFNVALSRDVPFHQPQQLQCLHNGSIKAHLCSPLYSISLSLYHIGRMHVMTLVPDLGKCNASRGASYIILCLDCKPNIRQAGNETKHNDTLC